MKDIEPFGFVAEVSGPPNYDVQQRFFYYDEAIPLRDGWTMHLETATKLYTQEQLQEYAKELVYEALYKHTDFGTGKENLVRHMTDILGKHQEIFAETAKKLKEAELELSKLKFQVEKQKPEIPEVPQSVADFIVGHKFNHYKMVEDFEKMSNDSEIKRWIFDNISTNAHGTDRGLKTLFELINHGYTVAKEKRFYLKNKLTELYLRFDSDDLFYFESADKESSLYKTTFTQQEIDSMDTGGYEQIEVEE